MNVCFKKRTKGFINLFFLCMSFLFFQERACYFVQAESVLEQGEFRLHAKNNWDENARKNAVDLTWDAVDDVSNLGYRLFQSEDGQSWKRISTEYNKTIRVLNVYPDIGNNLKKWMESADNPPVGLGKVLVTEVSIANYNKDPLLYLKDSKGYKYEVIMFGSWDHNGPGSPGKDLNEKSYNATREFAETGRGILFGHDTIANGRGWPHPYFNKFSTDLGIVHEERANIFSTKVSVAHDGYMMKYPHLLNQNIEYTIPQTHTLTQKIDKKSGAIVWMNLVKTTGGAVEDNEYFNNRYYLVTNKNLGMIQTGHSKGATTIEERKVIANTLYNLSQLSFDTFAFDYTVHDDKAPERPKVTNVHQDSENNLFFNISSEDIGKTYQWYVEADSRENNTLQSDIVAEEVLSDLAGYIYVIDEKEDSVPKVEKDAFGRVTNINLPITLPNKEATIEGVHGVRDMDKWIHIYAVDRADNVSSVAHIRVKDFIQTFQITETFTNESNQVIKEKLLTNYVPGQSYEKKPLEITGHIISGYRINDGPLLQLSSNETVFIPKIEAHDTINYVYKKIVTLHVRQVILAENEAVVIPNNGFLQLAQVNLDNPNDSAKSITAKMTSTVNHLLFEFTEVLMIEVPNFTGIKADLILPSYYEMLGYRFSNNSLNHESGPIKENGLPILDYTNTQEYWLTIYLKPTTTQPIPYHLSY